MTRFRPDPLRDAYILLAVAACFAIALGVIRGTGSDALPWYLSALPDPYRFTDYSAGYGFWFTPPIAFAMYPLQLLPWPVFAAAWVAISLACLYYLVGHWAIVALALPPVFAEVHQGNINLLLPAASLLMLRWPAIGSLLLLTKLTPGVALIWFLVRGEWRNLALAIGATIAIAGATFAIAPALWFDWFESLAANVGTEGAASYSIQIPLVVRALAAAILVAWGGRTGRRWTLPLAVVLAAPTLWFSVLAGMVGVVRGVALDKEARRLDGQSPRPVMAEGPAQA